MAEGVGREGIGAQMREQDGGVMFDVVGRRAKVECYWSLMRIALHGNRGSILGRFSSSIFGMMKDTLIVWRLSPSIGASERSWFETY